MDGRDICTTVLPHADVKIFLIASIAARAKRRELDYAEKGIHEDYDKIYQDIKLRDYKDSHREVSPLRKADDAVEIDTSNLNIEQVVAAILDVIAKKQKISPK
jgi:cytidylate kinase